MATTPFPFRQAVGHVGISVPDLDAGVEWYGKVFGFDPIVPPHEVQLTDDSLFREMCEDVFGERFRHMKNAHLATANGTAIELFQFIDPGYSPREDNFEYWRGGIFHFCVVAPDIEDQVARIVDSGGAQRSEIRELYHHRPVPYRACYCQDPWGTIIELTSHSHERLQANQR